MIPRETIEQIARNIAPKHNLSPELVLAVIEQESNFLPYSIRFEQAFLVKYVQPLYEAGKISKTECWARGFSWGLMQCMGEVAREHGYAGPLPQLCEPEVGIEAGCTILAANLQKAGGDITKALLLWNGGANKDYPKQVLARMPQVQSLTNIEAIADSADHV